MRYNVRDGKTKSTERRSGRNNTCRKMGVIIYCFFTHFVTNIHCEKLCFYCSFAASHVVCESRYFVQFHAAFFCFLCLLLTLWSFLKNFVPWTWTYGLLCLGFPCILSLYIHIIVIVVFMLFNCFDNLFVVLEVYIFTVHIKRLEVACNIGRLINLMYYYYHF